MAILGSEYSSSISGTILNNPQNNQCDEELRYTLKKLARVLNTCTNDSKINCVEAYRSFNNIDDLIKKCKLKHLE